MTCIMTSARARARAETKPFAGKFEVHLVAMASTYFLSHFCFTHTHNWQGISPHPLNIDLFNGCQADRRIQWLPGWLMYSVTTWLTYVFNGSLTYSMTVLLTDLFNGCLADWLIQWLPGWLTYSMTVLLTDLFNGCLADWLIQYLPDWLTYTMTILLTDVFNGCLADWLIQWLSGWLTYSMTVLLTEFCMYVSHVHIQWPTDLLNDCLADNCPVCMYVWMS